MCAVGEKYFHPWYERSVTLMQQISMLANAETKFKHFKENKTLTSNFTGCTYNHTVKGNCTPETPDQLPLLKQHQRQDDNDFIISASRVNPRSPATIGKVNKEFDRVRQVGYKSNSITVPEDKAESYNNKLQRYGPSTFSTLSLEEYLWDFIDVNTGHRVNNVLITKVSQVENGDSVEVQTNPKQYSADNVVYIPRDAGRDLDFCIVRNADIRLKKQARNTKEYIHYSFELWMPEYSVHCEEVKDSPTVGDLLDFDFEPFLDNTGEDAVGDDIVTFNTGNQELIVSHENKTFKLTFSRHRSKVNPAIRMGCWKDQVHRKSTLSGENGGKLHQYEQSPLYIPAWYTGLVHILNVVKGDFVHSQAQDENAYPVEIWMMPKCLGEDGKRCTRNTNGIGFDRKKKPKAGYSCRACRDTGFQIPGSAAGKIVMKLPAQEMMGLMSGFDVSQIHTSITRDHESIAACWEYVERETKLFQECVLGTIISTNDQLNITATQKLLEQASINNAIAPLADHIVWAYKNIATVIGYYCDIEAEDISFDIQFFDSMVELTDTEIAQIIAELRTAGAQPAVIAAYELRMYQCVFSDNPEKQAELRISQQFDFGAGMDLDARSLVASQACLQKKYKIRLMQYPVIWRMVAHEMYCEGKKFLDIKEGQDSKAEIEGMIDKYLDEIIAPEPTDEFEPNREPATVA